MATLFASIPGVTLPAPQPVPPPTVSGPVGRYLTHPGATTSVSGVTGKQGTVSAATVTDSGAGTTGGSSSSGGSGGSGGSSVGSLFSGG